MNAMQAYRDARRAREQEEQAMFDALRKHGAPELLGSTAIETDEYEDAGKIQYTVAAPLAFPQESLKAWLREQMDTRCQHSYDCCGHVYGSVLTHTLQFLRRTDESPRRSLYTVRYSWHRNV